LLFGLTLLIKAATILLLFPLLHFGRATFFSLTSLLFFILALLIRSSLLFLGLSFAGPALLIGLPSLLFLGLPLVIFLLALSLLVLRLVLLIPLLSFPPCLPLAVRAVLGFLGRGEAGGTRKSQDAKHRQAREISKISCFHG